MMTNIGNFEQTLLQHPEPSHVNLCFNCFALISSIFLKFQFPFQFHFRYIYIFLHIKILFFLNHLLNKYICNFYDCNIYYQDPFGYQPRRLTGHPD